MGRLGLCTVYPDRGYISLLVEHTTEGGSKMVVLELPEGGRGTASLMAEGALVAQLFFDRCQIKMYPNYFMVMLGRENGISNTHLFVDAVRRK